jgi:hypothetical protein
MRVYSSVVQIIQLQTIGLLNHKLEKLWTADATFNLKPGKIHPVPIPVAARSKPWICVRSLAGIVVSNPAGSMVVSFECCVLSRRGLCVGLITPPEESY